MKEIYQVVSDLGPEGDWIIATFQNKDRAVARLKQEQDAGDGNAALRTYALDDAEESATEVQS